MRALPLLSLLLAGSVSCVQASETKRYAVRLSEGATELAEAVRNGSFNRWVVPNKDGLELVVGPTSQTAGDFEITARLLPADDQIRSP